MRLFTLQLSCRLFLAKHHITQVCQPRFGSMQPLVFPKAKIAFEREDNCECDGHTVHKLSQRRLTADWLAPRNSDCSLMRSKVSSDWLPSYIKATRPVLKIFKMAGYFPNSPRTYIQRHVTKTTARQMSRFLKPNINPQIKTMHSSIRTSICYRTHVIRRNVSTVDHIRHICRVLKEV